MQKKTIEKKTSKANISTRKNKKVSYGWLCAMKMTRASVMENRAYGPCGRQGQLWGTSPTGRAWKKGPYGPIDKAADTEAGEA